MSKIEREWGDQRDSNGITFKNYFEARIEAVREVHEAYIRTLEKRLEGMNEFRTAMKDQSDRMVNKDEYRYLVEKVNSLEISRAELLGKASMQSVVIAYVLSALAMMISVINVVINWKS